MPVRALVSADAVELGLARTMSATPWNPPERQFVSKATGYLLAALITVVAASAVQLQQHAVAFYGTEGGDPTTTAVLAAVFVVSSIGVLVVRFRTKN